MQLLIEPTSPGFPAEYLAARLRGRSNKYLTDWRGFADGKASLAEHGAEGAESFGALVRWCFLQMERPLRTLFAPLLFFLECRTVILCLRFIKTDGTSVIEPLLLQSLLGAELRKILLAEASLDLKLSGLAAALASSDRHFAELPGITGQQGALPLFEQYLLVGALNRMVVRVLPSLMRKFTRHLIDCRNLLAVNKYLRWQEKSRPVLASGGLIPPLKLHRSESPAALLRLARVCGYGLEEKMRGDRLETELGRFLSRRLRAHGLSDDCPTQMLLFLWQAYLEQRNRSLLFEGRHLDRPLLLEELVY